MKLILDLSHYNKVTDWSAVKKAVDGVILRCAYRGYGSGKIVADSKFKEYAEACKRVGLPFGIYFMSQAINETEAIEEAVYSVNMAKKYGATLPIFIDSEDGDGTAKVVRADGLSKNVRTNVVKAFCNKVEKSGYAGGVYASESWFTGKLNFEALAVYFIWVAKYGKNTGVKNSTVKLSECDLHQYTSKGKVNGVKGNVDLSELYVDSDTFIGDGDKANSGIYEEAYDMPTIKKGSKGKAVKIWQIIVGVEPDGDFGSKTLSATKTFQKAKGLTVDGIVGGNSWSAGLESV